MLALPVVVIVHALLTAGEMREMRNAYLRGRAGAVAARLETLPAGTSEEARLDALTQEEPSLAGLRIFERGEKGEENAGLAPLWNGRVLFRTAAASANGEKVFRAYVPFHSPDGLRIARIDLAASTADFLMTHARHNLTLAIVVAVVLWALAVYMLWASRRMAALEREQLELAHLAQIGRLSAVLAHEIRNPLGTIKGFVQLAAERGDESVRALLEPIVQEALRLENLITNLLMFGRPQEPKPRPILWRPLAEEATQGVEGRAVIGDSADWEIETDPDLLKQVLLNLVRNAVEASNGGEVRIDAQGDRGGFSIRVADNGPGLPAEVKARLFEPFVTTKASGTGLGLSIAKRLTEALGGTLELRDNDPRGTVAHLAFPRMKWKRSS